MRSRWWEIAAGHVSALQVTQTYLRRSRRSTTRTYRVRHRANPEAEAISRRSTGAARRLRARRCTAYRAVKAIRHSRPNCTTAGSLALARAPSAAAAESWRGCGRGRLGSASELERMGNFRSFSRRAAGAARGQTLNPYVPIATLASSAALRCRRGGLAPCDRPKPGSIVCPGCTEWSALSRDRHRGHRARADCAYHTPPAVGRTVADATLLLSCSYVGAANSGPARADRRLRVVSCATIRQFQRGRRAPLRKRSRIESAVSGLVDPSSHWDGDRRSDMCRCPIVRGDINAILPRTGLPRTLDDSSSSLRSCGRGDAHFWQNAAAALYGAAPRTRPTHCARAAAARADARRSARGLDLTHSWRPHGGVAH